MSNFQKAPKFKKNHGYLKVNIGQGKKKLRMALNKSTSLAAQRHLLTACNAVQGYFTIMLSQVHIHDGCHKYQNVGKALSNMVYFLGYGRRENGPLRKGVGSKISADTVFL